MRSIEIFKQGYLTIIFQETGLYRGANIGDFQVLKASVRGEFKEQVLN